MKKGIFKCLNLATNWSRKRANYPDYLRMWSRLREEECYSIPEDVPRGHLAVYVGEECKRYVIKIGLLKHPLFMALLDHAEEVLGFSTGSKLWTPCNENIFLSIINCVSSSQKNDRRVLFCF